MTKKDILKIISPVKRKMYLQNILNTVITFFLMSSTVLLIISIYSHFFVFPFVGRAMIAALIGGILAGILIGGIRIPKTKKVLLVTDSFGLDERLITAYQFIDDDSEGVRLQRQETMKFLSDKKLEKLYHIQLKGKWLIISLCILAISVGLLYITSDAKEEARVYEDLSQKVLKEIEKIDDKKKEIDDQYSLDEEIIDEVEKELDELIDRLKKVETEEEALMELSIAKSELEKIPIEMNKDLKNLQEMLKNNTLKGLVEAMANEDKAAMGEGLNELLDKISDEEMKEEILNELEALLNTLEDEELKEALKALADGIADNNPKAVESGANKLASEISSSLLTAQNLADLSAQMSAAINEAGQSIAAEKSISEMAFSNGTNSQSANSQISASQSTGQDGNSSNRQEGNQAGAGVGTESTNVDTGYSEDNGSVTGIKPSPEIETSMGQYEALYDPSRIGGESEPTYVQGIRGEGGSNTTNEVSDRPMATGELIDYKQIYQEYSQVAKQNLDELDVPMVMKDIVINYFSSIE